MTTEEQLLNLEKIAKQLEPSPAQRLHVRERVLAYTEDFLNSIEDLNAYNFTDEKGEGLLNTAISEDGIGIEKALEIIEKNVDFPGLNPASGGHLGYIPGGGIYYSALGDYLADVTNRYSGIFFGGPGAVRMENMLIRWVADLIGYPKESAGNLTSGGSIANLIAICTARDVKKITAEKLTKSVIYLTQQIHHSVQKALRIAGLGECVLRYVEIDERFKMRPDILQKQISDDKKAGLNPFLIIASAGTTDTGAIDPLEQIAAISTAESLWLHIDAAYGGFFILTDEGREKLKGMELSDSLTIDAHKGMFLPYGSGMVLVKRKEDLFATYYYEANYMQDTLSATEELSPADLSPELTKHFRGMRFWLPLQLHGLKPFRACLDEKLLLTKYFHQKIKELGFESEIEPELSVAIFRYVPETGDPNLFNKKLIDAVQHDGRIFISSTMLNGNFTLRFACLAFRTHKREVDMLLEIIKNEMKKF
jgi:aromatic-L-amino-acid/L-tryptophan decarboxylase